MSDLLNQDGLPINGALYGPVIAFVERLLNKSMATTGKGELCRLIMSQTIAIEKLLAALHQVAPNHDLLPKSLVSGQSGNVPDSTKA
jgi:hypothetical protein